MREALRALLRPELAEMSAYAPAEAPPGAVRLDANEAPAAASDAIRRVVAEAVARAPLERYPDARALALKEAISARTGARVDDLLVGTGSDEVISLVLNALARPRPKLPQAVVLTPTPTFVMYRITARGHGMKSMEVPLDARWDLDANAMKSAIAAVCPNVVFIASPNNPTGNRMADAALQAVIEAASDAFVVLDEAYVDYAGGSLRAWRERYPHLGVLRTVSKIGLAALRVGWLEADPDLVREIDKVRQPFNVSATSQAAATAVLGEAWPKVEEEIARVVGERARVSVEIERLGGFRVTPSAANFVWVKTERQASEVAAELARRGVIVRSFHAMGGRLSNQLRITIGAEKENDRLLDALKDLAA
jgi:histidinol-phosphate aminotransferase